VGCAENIQLCHHAEQRHCDVLEIVAPFMDAVQEGTQRVVHIDGAIFVVLQGENETTFRVQLAAMVL